MVEQELARQFEGCEFPEHVEEALKPILEIAHSEANLEGDEWERVFESLATDVEFGEAGWLDE